MIPDFTLDVTWSTIGENIFGGFHFWTTTWWCRVAFFNCDMFYKKKGFKLKWWEGRKGFLFDLATLPNFLLHGNFFNPIILLWLSKDSSPLSLNTVENLPWNIFFYLRKRFQTLFFEQLCINHEPNVRVFLDMLIGEKKQIVCSMHL